MHSVEYEVIPELYTVVNNGVLNNVQSKSFTFLSYLEFFVFFVDNLSWSWGIAILAVILHIASIVLFFLTKRSEDQQ